MDRSILSTYAYGIGLNEYLGLFNLVREYDPVIVYFEKVYDTSKLPSDHERVLKRYKLGLNLLTSWLHLPVITTSAETFMTKVNSLERLQQLLINKAMPNWTFFMSTGL